MPAASSMSRLSPSALEVHRRHPEERPLGRVSKDGRLHLPPSSFEAREELAPQDDDTKSYFASSFERLVAAATARVSSDCMPSGPISTSSAAAVVPPGEVTFWGSVG